MDICTATANPTGCGHWHLTATIGGVSVSVELHELELLEPFTDNDRSLMLRLLARALRQSGVTLPQFLHRVLKGDEATNVKIYSFFGPGAAITKTNIGTSYVNICPGLNGERIVVDFTGCTQYRLQLHADVPGSGQIGVRVVRDTDGAVLHEAPTIGASGEREGDTDWQDLPAAFVGEGLTYLRAEAKSTTAQDDPVFRGLRVGLR